jgi:STE24 endopeptidase
MESSSLTLLFAAAVMASLSIKLWLTTRLVRHVAANRNNVPSAFAGTITLEAHQRAADYTLAKARFGLLGTAFATAILIGWTFLGGLDVLNRALIEAVMPRFGPMAYQLSLLVAFASIGGLLELPFDLYGTFRLEARFGFNRITWRLYIADMLKGLALGAVIGLPFAALVLWIMARSGGLWWLWTWGAWVAFMLVMQVLGPTVIAPLFNRFEPLRDESLKQRIQSLMNRCGFTSKGLFVMDGSKRSAHANAYFTGFGAVKRVVFFDTLLGKLTPAEVEAVLAHELGHLKHKHVLKYIVSRLIVSLAGLALLGWLASRMWFYEGLGTRASMNAPNDALALLLFFLAVPVFGFFVSPLFALVSRKHEFQADAFACAQASGHDLAAALLKLHEDNASTLTPDPIYVRFFYSHPPASERLAALT